MLCCDELWFLDRVHCPADMQELDFARFVPDENPAGQLLPQPGT
ncbi:hypothetical protein [Streptomyces decoyicus]